MTATDKHPDKHAVKHPESTPKRRRFAPRPSVARQLRLQNARLNAPNRAFFAQLELYTGLRSFFKARDEVARSLLEIQTDMLDAQNDGLSAEAYFGADPVQTANALLRALPNSRRATARLAGFGTLDLLVALAVPALMLPSRVLDIGRLLLVSGGGVGLALALCAFLSRLAFTQRRRDWALGVFGATVIAGLGLAALVPAYFWVRTPWRLTLTATTASWTLLVLMGVVLSQAPRFLRQTGWGGLPLVWVLISSAGIGVALRQPASLAWLLRDEHLLWVMAANFGLLLVVTCIGLFVTRIKEVPHD